MNEVKGSMLLDFAQWMRIWMSIDNFSTGRRKAIVKVLFALADACISLKGHRRCSSSSSSFSSSSSSSSSILHEEVCDYPMGLSNGNSGNAPQWSMMMLWCEHIISCLGVPRIEFDLTDFTVRKEPAADIIDSRRSLARCL